ncbi:MAG: ParB/RepB/Spo0J family partition protein [Dehalococcoidia bacterium]|nr:ParB/RepB/Spo0J family partition protein [Dehalococcoidia bacterium]
MTKAKGGLGRGLGAVIPSYVPGIESVDVDLIVPNPNQPRTYMDPDLLQELAESIREHGIIQPLLVSVKESPGGMPTYQLIAGERRLNAARMAGLTRVPVVVKEASSRETLELALVENLQRSDLSPLEEAQAFKRLAEEFSLTQEEVARRVGKSRTTITNVVRLLTLSDEIKASLAGGEISEGHARALLGLQTAEDRRHAWRLVVQKGLTVRQTEEIVRTWGGRKERKAKRDAVSRTEERSMDVMFAEERLTQVLGTKVSLEPSRNGGGQIVIHFYSDEELGDIIGRLVRLDASSQ